LNPFERGHHPGGKLKKEVSAADWKGEMGARGKELGEGIAKARKRAHSKEER